MSEQIAAMLDAVVRSTPERLFGARVRFAYTEDERGKALMCFVLPRGSSQVWGMTVWDDGSFLPPQPLSESGASQVRRDFIGV